MWIQDAVAIVGTILGLSGLGFGLHQYRTAQKWKKSEFAAKQLEMLCFDPKLAMCCLFLDYSKRTVPVPERYQIHTDEKVFIHVWNTLERALRPESEKELFPFPEVLYRDYFDHFFAYLERVNHYLSIELFSLSDVSSLEYWLQQIATPRFVDRSRRHLIFRDFIRTYGYEGVEELMGDFGIAFQKDEGD